MAAKLNPSEEDVQYAAEVFLELVQDLVDELAPVRPWWTQDLTDDEALWRWAEGETAPRAPIVAWLTEAGIFMGFKTYQELLDNLEKFWMGNLLVDVVPPEVIDMLPVELVELVQAGPYDAADHIRRMEKLFAKRMAGKAIMDANRPPLPEIPEAVGEHELPAEAEEG